MKPLKTIVEMLRNIESYPHNSKALSDYENDAWISMSTDQFLQNVKWMAYGLLSIDVNPGDKVALLAPSSSKWVIIDLAIMSIGAITVPLFSNISPENFVFEVLQAETKKIFTTSGEVESFFASYRHLFETVIYLDISSQREKPDYFYDELLRRGKEFEKENPGLYEKLAEKVKPESLASIIYTSGSTGTPKGVELTQQAIVALLHIENFHWDPKNDRYLSVLPLAHIFGRVLNLCLLGWSVSVYYFNDLKNVGHACQQVHPTLLVVVPRLLEKVYAKMLSHVEQETSFKRKIGLWAFDIANNEHETFFNKLMYPIVDKSVYSALRKSLGGSIRLVISGGASLDSHLCHFFSAIGVPVYQGWGLTEASTVAANYPGHNKFGTVGKPLDVNLVKTSESGELLVKGPLVMRGYYKDPEATKAAIDPEGWFHTGDRGLIDEEGYITIMGRMRELYKSSTGENIVPYRIEQALCRAALIDMALVVGHNKPFVSCLLFPDLAVVQQLKATHQMQNLSDEQFLHSSFIQEEMKKLLDAVNAHLNHWEQIHAYYFILEPLTIAGGGLTPSMKIRRDLVLAKYKKVIDEIYLASIQK